VGFREFQKKGQQGVACSELPLPRGIGVGRAGCLGDEQIQSGTMHGKMKEGGKRKRRVLFLQERVWFRAPEDDWKGSGKAGKSEGGRKSGDKGGKKSTGLALSCGFQRLMRKNEHRVGAGRLPSQKTEKTKPRKSEQGGKQR